MMRNVTGVMKDSLDRAEAYVPLLPVEGGADTSELEYHRDRSGSSTQFDESADHDILPPNSPYFLRLLRFGVLLVYLLHL